MFSSLRTLFSKAQQKPWRVNFAQPNHLPNHVLNDSRQFQFFSTATEANIELNLRTVADFMGTNDRMGPR